MMERTPELWSEAVLDVLVVGAGIHGAAIAFHAARAGYRVALVDKGDFSSATSANSLKILHGGFRYLQHGNLKRMRHSIVSRREMMQLAPWLVRPLPCLMPLYGGGITRNRTLLTGALWVNHWIGRDRNRGLDPALHLPRGEVLGPEACLEAAPGISTAGLRGGLV
ncbi:MAG: hypothetical protein Kow0089_00580 [Desulfobulbaceae bacterium]